MMKGGLGWTTNIRNELARLVMRTNNVLLLFLFTCVIYVCMYVYMYVCMYVCASM